MLWSKGPLWWTLLTGGYLRFENGIQSIWCDRLCSFVILCGRRKMVSSGVLLEHLACRARLRMGLCGHGRFTDFAYSTTGKTFLWNTVSFYSTCLIHGVSFGNCCGDRARRGGRLLPVQLFVRILRSVSFFFCWNGASCIFWKKRLYQLGLFLTGKVSYCYILAHGPGNPDCQLGRLFPTKSLEKDFSSVSGRDFANSLFYCGPSVSHPDCMGSVWKSLPACNHCASDGPVLFSPRENKTQLSGHRGKLRIGNQAINWKYNCFQVILFTLWCTGCNRGDSWCCLTCAPSFWAKW